METKKRKQIAFDITEDLHTKIKVLAAQRNITMNNWMQRAIFERIAKEERKESND